jgi:hypothetical protein
MVVLVQKGNMKRPFELLYILSVFPWFCVIYSEPSLPVLNPEPAQVAGQVMAKRSLIKLGSIQQGDTPFKRIPRASKLNADLSGAVRRQEGADVSIVGMTPHAQTVGKHDAKTTFEVYRLLDVGQCTDASPWREDRMAGDRQTNNLKTSFGQLRRFMEVRCRCNNALVSPLSQPRLKRNPSGLNGRIDEHLRNVDGDRRPEEAAKHINGRLKSDKMQKIARQVPKKPHERLEASNH